MGWNRLTSNGNEDWDNKVFNVPANVQQDVPFDIAVSDIFTNNNDLESVDIALVFQDINPGGEVNGTSPSYQIFAVLEEEIETGEFNIIAESFGQFFQTLNNGREIKFIVQTKNPSDQGQPFNTINGFKWFVNENPSERLRVRICGRETNPGGPASLQSITLSGSQRLY